MNGLLNRLFLLRSGELSRIVPFFGLYLTLFAGLTVADGVSIALFVQQVGVDHLPRYYAINALINLALLVIYVRVGERFGAVRTFQGIIALYSVPFALAWAGLTEGQSPAWYGVLFVCRETALSLVLMHFGMYLRDYFTRDELNRMLPLIYAGGRVGGLMGGMALEGFTAAVGLINMILVVVALGIICGFVVAVIALKFQPAPDEEDDPGMVAAAQSSTMGFLKYIRSTPLLFWMIVGSLVFVTSRWMLNYQYNEFFGDHFSDGVAMAEFLGRYTQIALVVALVLQLVVVNRLVTRIGPGGIYLLYGGLLLVSVAWNVVAMSLAAAVFCRMIETELRYGVRNPSMQLLHNRFPKVLRFRVKAWSMGAVVPVATLTAAGLLGFLATSAPTWIAWIGLGIGLVYFACSIGVWRGARDPKHVKAPVRRKSLRSPPKLEATWKRDRVTSSPRRRVRQQRRRRARTRS